MKTPCVVLAAFLAAWSWRTAAPAPETRSWPPDIPAFAPAREVGFATTLGNGSSFVNLVVPEPAVQVLDSAIRAYAEAGWCLSPVRTRDMLVFTRDEAVAAVLVQETARGTRVTALQRPRGLCGL